MWSVGMMLTVPVKIGAPSSMALRVIVYSS
jgi:hypothetical protein